MGDRIAASLTFMLVVLFFIIIGGELSPAHLLVYLAESSLELFIVYVFMQVILLLIIMFLLVSLDSFEIILFMLMVILFFEFVFSALVYKLAYKGFVLEVM